MTTRSTTLLGVLSLLVACSFVQRIQRTTTMPNRRRELAVLPPFKTFIDGNGTLQVGRKPNPIPCRYFVLNHPNNRDNNQDAKDGEQQPQEAVAPLIPPGVVIKKLHYHFDDCAEHQLGNRLGEHYLNYMIANAARIPYQMTCGDDRDMLQIIDPTHEKKLHESVLKHLEVNLMDQPGPVPLDSWGGAPWSVETACGHCCRGGWWCHIGLDTMVHPIIINDMRKLAATSESAAAALSEPEEVVIHLRLGDALRGKHDEGIGILPHQAYTQLLEQLVQEDGPITSIGIVTQPFHKKLVRSFDLNDHALAKSKLITYDLVDFLREKFPTAKVTIHNGKDEIPIVSYARLIRATRAAICGPSTFCTMPVLATMAKKGFIFRAEKHSPWAQHVATAFHNNKLDDAAVIQTYKVPRLANNYSSILSGEEIVHWLRHQLPHVGEFVVAEPPLVRNGDNFAEVPDGSGAPDNATNGAATIVEVGDAS